MNNYTQPYFGASPIQPYAYQPMYQNMPQGVPQNLQTNIQPPIQKNQTNDLFQRLQGKTVDSIDVVKATDIPLDGSISYFPLTDGSTIVTKQLQMDGTSKMTIYRPVENEEEVKTPKYLTENDLQNALKKIDNKDIKDEIKSLRKQIKDLDEEIEELKDRKD